jgi:hypothetical protein
VTAERRRRSSVVALGVAACVACCAVPLATVIGGAGLATAVATWAAGAVAPAIGIAAVTITVIMVIPRRRRRQPAALVQIESLRTGDARDSMPQ